MLLSQVIEKWRKKSWVQIPHLTFLNMKQCNTETLLKCNTL